MKDWYSNKSSFSEWWVSRWIFGSPVSLWDGEFEISMLSIMKISEEIWEAEYGEEGWIEGE